MQNNKHPLKGLSPTEIFVYKGVNVKVLIGGYEVFGKKCLTTEGVDDLIYKANLIIQKSMF
jgi:hypothetical protein